MFRNYRDCTVIHFVPKTHFVITGCFIIPNLLQQEFTVSIYNRNTSLMTTTHILSFSFHRPIQPLPTPLMTPATSLLQSLTRPTTPLTSPPSLLNNPTPPTTQLPLTTLSLTSTHLNSCQHLASTLLYLLILPR